MAGLNKVLLIGRLGRDPEIKYSQQGTAICNMAIATSENWNDKNTGEKKESVEWHRVVVFGKQAETCEKYLNKGSQIYIEGRLQNRQYDKDGLTHYTTEIVVSNFLFLGGGQRNDSGSQQQNRPTQQNQSRQQSQNTPQQSNHDEPYYSDDIPF